MRLSGELINETKSHLLTVKNKLLMFTAEHVLNVVISFWSIDNTTKAFCHQLMILSRLFEVLMSVQANKLVSFGFQVRNIFYWSHSICINTLLIASWLNTKGWLIIAYKIFITKRIPQFHTSKYNFRNSNNYFFYTDKNLLRPVLLNYRWLICHGQMEAKIWHGE